MYILEVLHGVLYPGAHKNGIQKKKKRLAVGWSPTSGRNQVAQKAPLTSWVQPQTLDQSSVRLN